MTILRLGLLAAGLIALTVKPHWSVMGALAALFFVM